MPNFVCVTCGIQYAGSEQPPEHCVICEDERQYVGWEGQRWTTLDELGAKHRLVFREEEAGLHSIVSEPAFAIGQRAHLVRSGHGNVLWDCIAPLTADALETIRSLGGVRAIAISHPHYYTTMIEWSRALDAPVYLHEADRKWVVREDGDLRFWKGETYALFGGMTLIRSGGHFAGYQVLHWAAGVSGQGALLAGDQPQVCYDSRWVTFLYSYPNMIPLGPSAIRGILASLEPFAFERIYGAFGRHVLSDAKGVVQRSAERYLRFIKC